MQEEKPFIEEPPIKYGEIFDPEKEIQVLLKVPKEERKQKLAEFKEKLTFQKVGLARVQDILINEIRSKPNGKIEDFYDMATEMGAEFGMNETQRKDTKEVLARYEKQHNAIENIRKEFPSDKDLFRALFNKIPKGKIEVVVGPVSLSFKCHDFEDYMAVFFFNRMKGSGKKRDFTDEEREEAMASKGVNVPSLSYPDIGWAIMAENASGVGNFSQSDKESKQIFTHEEQHTIKSFFEKEELLDPNHPSLLFPVRKSFLDAQTEAEKEKILERYFRAFRHNAEEYAKDEILAYYKDGRLSSVYESLAETDGGNYDYLADPKKIDYLWMKTSDEIRALSKRVRDRVLIEEYKEILANGVDSVRKMEAGGYDKEEIIALLTHEPLAKWGKAVGRVLGK